MNTSWRLFLAALRFMTHRPTPSGNAAGELPHEATRLFPVIGMLLGLMAAGIYWLGAQLWPTSVAVALSMAATLLATANPAGESTSTAPGHVEPGRHRARLGAAYWVFSLLVKYNALMALTAATGPFPLPAYLTLGLIMIVGQASSYGLVVSSLKTEESAAARATTLDLGIALVLGFLPATLLGIPGLAGLVSGIVMRLVLTARVLPRRNLEPRQQLEVTQQLTEVCFYLGAVATWRYV